MMLEPKNLQYFKEVKKEYLYELPGLKDPERIKALLGKTAQLNFRLVSENNEFGTR